jgi:hypothetical protein
MVKTASATHSKIELRAYEIFLARRVHIATIWPAGSRLKGKWTIVGTSVAEPAASGTSSQFQPR